MGAEVEALDQNVTDLETTTERATQLLDNLASLIEANKTDPAKIQAIADRIRADKEKLSAAVDRDTPPA